MENLPINNGNGQSFGFVLYEMTVCSGGRLHANAPDEAQVGLGVSLQQDISQALPWGLPWAPLLFAMLLSTSVCEA